MRQLSSGSVVMMSAVALAALMGCLSAQGGSGDVRAAEAGQPVTVPARPATPDDALWWVAAKGEPLLDLRGSAPEGLSNENFHLTLTATNVLTGWGPAKGEPDRDAIISIRRAEGEWREASASAPRYNQAKHGADTSKLTIEGNRINGPIVLTVNPDRWEIRQREDEAKPYEVTLTIAATITKNEQGDWTLAGKHSVKIPVNEKAYEGELKGTFSLPRRDERWDKGKRAADGVAFEFDMGQRRVNWNHARNAIIAFEPAKDVSRFDGLRVKVATDEPRGDAQVSVWLGEVDGSWYYLRHGVPLVDKENAAYLPFEDFAEAEWVSPGNHMDEDYVLDRTAIRYVAVGVVNPLGVGKVSFRVTAIDLLKEEKDKDKPVDVTFTGKLLSVNDHDVIPAPIFGGYAGYIPQEYRPGCQRNLYAPSYPIVPRQKWVEFSRSDIIEWQPIMAALRGEVDDQKAFSKHVLAVLDERSRKRIEEFRFRKPKKTRDDRPYVPGELRDTLDQLIRQRELYKAELWQGIAIPDDLQAEIKRLQKDELNDTEVMWLNRALLELRFPKAIKPFDRVGPTEQYYLNCFGERKNRAHLLYRKDWKEMFEGYGKSLALNAKKAGYQSHWEFWNEPYLHWGAKDRINLATKLFDQENAKEGGPVQVKYSDGTLGPVIPHFVWVKGANGELRVEDSSAFTYWSGSGNGWIYDQMLKAAASTIKKHNPDVRIIAGWGFRWNEDHWASWDLLYKNTIDRNIEWIDGLHEHHYQGDPTAMPASYEVAVGYAWNKYGKWLHCFNTETNDLIDAPARGAVETPGMARAATGYRRLVYNLRDMLYCVYATPDKAEARTMIHGGQYPQSQDVCFGFLMNLRGRLVEGQSPDPQVWAVASIDGTDPKAMPPHWDGVKRLVAIVYNDARSSRKVNITLTPPTGTTFAGEAIVERTIVDKETFEVARPKEAPVKVDAKSARFSATLPERMGWKVTIPLKGELPKQADVSRRQFFSDDIIQKVKPAKPLATRVKVDGKVLEAADRAWLRLVAEDIGMGEATVFVNGKPYAIPHAFTADNVCRIIEVPIDRASLREYNQVVAVVNKGNHAGYLLPLTSIVLEDRR